MLAKIGSNAAQAFFSSVPNTADGSATQEATTAPLTDIVNDGITEYTPCPAEGKEPLTNDPYNGLNLNDETASRGVTFAFKGTNSFVVDFTCNRVAVTADDNAECTFMLGGETNLVDGCLEPPDAPEEFTAFFGDGDVYCTAPWTDNPMGAGSTVVESRLRMLL